MQLTNCFCHLGASKIDLLGFSVRIDGINVRLKYIQKDMKEVPGRNAKLTLKDWQKPGARLLNGYLKFLL
jgi:hypothetical protein